MKYKREVLLLFNEKKKVVTTISKLELENFLKFSWQDLGHSITKPAKFLCLTCEVEASLGEPPTGAILADRPFSSLLPLHMASSNLQIGTVYNSSRLTVKRNECCLESIIW